jgi:hypothetical protein
MNGKWIFQRDFDSVAALVSQFECAEVVLTIKPLQTRPDCVIFGCYIPTQPRPTSIILGRIILRRLPDRQTELQVKNLPDWAEPFIQAMIKSIRESEDHMI